MEQFEKIAQVVIDAGKKEIAKAINEALEQSIDPVDILEKGLRRGIEVVGSKFEKMEIFLPELVGSADTMIMGIDILQPLLKAKGEGSSLRKEGTIVIGTVQHDLHDIGKNIVSTFLNVSGFEIHDLGTDVPAHIFVDKAEEVHADVICLSALLSNTMPYMRDVIAELERRGLRKRYVVLVGGGVVTQDWADQIGADGYGRDFAEAVHVAKELIELRSQDNDK
ncbi:MAG: hypothetical protein GTO12_16615 [Proteobacteria bacterium]|nr:hypothetical protein [Pseudomonadota bacterium]